MALSSARSSSTRFDSLHALLVRLRLRPAGAGWLEKRQLFRPRLEMLEDRVVPAGSWQNLAASGSAPPNGGGAMMLLSNGSVLIQDGLNSNSAPGQSPNFFQLSPQTNTGSYVNGAWSGTGSMSEKRLFFSTATLPDGRVFAVGGEYPKFSNTAEIYDPTTGVWSSVDSVPTLSTNVDLSGTVTGASNASPIVITTASTQQLQNGMQVTVSSVNGNTAANGTFTVAGLTSTSFQLAGSTGNGNYTGGGKWSAFVPQFGDDPLEVLSTGPNSGQILAGYFFNSTTFRFNPAAAPGSQWTQTAQGKLHNDSSDEESWVKLPDGSILSYDVFASAKSGTFQAQRYIPSQDKWVDASTLSATNPPSVLTSGTQGSELGPAFLQPDGKVIYFGANGNTAIYDPTTDTWSAGFNEPQKNLTITPDAGQNNYTVTAGGNPTFLAGTDDPGAMLPNGHILIALSPVGPLKNNGAYSFPEASYIYEYDPTATTAAAAWTEVTPGGLSGVNAFQLNMVVLPTGQVLLSNEGAGFQVYTEDASTGPQNAWRPTITRMVDNGDGTYTLTGTQLNGISEGSNYGDDNESASNYPILQFQDSGGNIYYGHTFNWSSTGVATGSTPVSVQFTLPAGKNLSDLTTVTAIANGIPSASSPLDIAPILMPPPDQSSVEGSSQAFNLGSFRDPDGGPWSVDINWGDGGPDDTFNVTSAGSLGTRSHTFGEEGSKTVTITVTDTSDNQSDSKTFTVNVSDPAVQASGVAVSAVEGAAFTGKSIATFKDPGGAEPNPSDPSGTHYQVVSIDWGDGTALDTTSGAVSYSGAPGSTTDPFTVSGNHTYGEEGTYTITAILNHEGVLTKVQSQVTVSDPAVVATGVPIFGVECRTLTVQTATFTDPGGAEPNPSDPTGGIANHYTASIDWGDSTPDSAGTITFASGVFTVTGSHAYQHEGSYTVTTTINHEGIITVTTSTAIIKDDLGLLLLDPTGSKSLMVTGNGSVAASGCGAVVVDSSDGQAAFLTGHGTVTAEDIDVTGGVKTAGHAGFSGPVDHEAPTPDPLGLTLPIPPAPTFAAVHDTSSTPLMLSPGTYVGGIAVSGQGSVTLAPGVYYMEGGGFSITGKGSVVGTGVTIINAPGGPGDTISIAGQGSLNLGAPTGGPFQGVVIFQAPASSNTVRFTGQASVTVAGVVYAPAALVSIDGNANVTINAGPGTAVAPPPILGALIAYDLKVDGNGVLTINPDPPGAMLVAASTVAPSNNSTGVVPLAVPGASSNAGSTQGDDNLVQVAIVLGRSQQAIGNNSAPAVASGASTVATNQALLDQLFSAGYGGNKGGKFGSSIATEVDASSAQTMYELLSNLPQGA